MADNTNKNYTREMLNSTKVLGLRKIASSFKVPDINVKHKEQLINDILKHQQRLPFKPAKTTNKTYIKNSSTTYIETKRKIY